MAISSIQIPSEIYLSSSKIYVNQNAMFVLDAQKGSILTQYQGSSTNYFTLNKETIYFIHNNRKFLQALSAIDGKILWNFHVEEDFLLSPSFDDNAVYISTREGFLYCLELNTGAQLWRKELGKTLLTNISIYRQGIYLACIDFDIHRSYICALSTEDGSLLWEILTPHSIVWPLFILEDVIYASMTTSCYAISASEGKLLWKQDIGKEINSSPTLYKDMLYLCCFEPHYLFSSPGISPQIAHQPWISTLRKSDGQPLWQKQLGIDTHARNVSFLACASDKVFASTDDGYITAINYSDGNILWRSKTAGTLLSTPKVLNDVVYVGVNDGNVYAFYIDDGSLLWTTFVGNGVSRGFVDVLLDA